MSYFKLLKLSMRFEAEIYQRILLLPSATVVAERLCFRRCLSVHRVGGRHPPRDTVPLQQTATAADGTRPTGMHSCLLIVFCYNL